MSLYGQLQISKVKDIHESISNELPIKEASRDISGVSTLSTIIPVLGPYLELNSITSIFKDMKSVANEYSVDNSSKVFKEVNNKYVEELLLNGEPLYLYNYNSAVKSMLYYFSNYVTLGSESEIVIDAKEILSKDLKLLQITFLFKIILYGILFIFSVIGLFVFKGRYSQKEENV